MPSKGKFKATCEAGNKIVIYDRKQNEVYCACGKFCDQYDLEDKVYIHAIKQKEMQRIR
jgi:hypothetical protein